MQNGSPKATQQSVKWINNSTMVVTEKYWIMQYLSPYLQAPRVLQQDGVPDGQIVSGLCQRQSRLHLNRFARRCNSRFTLRMVPVRSFLLTSFSRLKGD